MAVRLLLVFSCAVTWVVASRTGPGEPTVPASLPASVPASPLDLLARADALFMRGAYAEAQREYRVLLGREKVAVRAAVGLARCAEQTGGYPRAVETLRLVAGPGRKSPGWQESIASLLQRLGQYSQAIDHCRAALAINEAHFAARLRLGELYQIVGKKQDAIEAYRWFDSLLRTRRRLPALPADITCAGRGFYRFSVLARHPNLNRRVRYVLHEIFQPTYERVARNYWPARLAAAELLLEKYNLEEADEDFRAALTINKNLPEANVGLGAIALERWQFDRVEAHATAALAINPDCVPAINLLALLRMTERRYGRALNECRRALKVNPNDIDALSISAAAHLVLRNIDAVEEFQSRIGRINPCCGRMHYILGEWLAARRQFAEAEDRYRKAIECAPERANPRTALGMMYMQWGYEAKARIELDKAWALDNFNARTYNTLNLLDALERFDRRVSDHFTLKYEAGRDRVIAPYFSEYLEAIYQSICDRYQHQPPAKTIVEVFPSHRELAIRITAKPWIHTVGACTGRVIAMDAPRRETAGRAFNWTHVLRHELTHTVTLSASRNRIPHWFTEGLAVWQEQSPRSWAWIKLLTVAVRRGRLFDLESIDWGFVRPGRPHERWLAYAQSEWMCEYIIDRYGREVINRMIKLFAEGKGQEEAFGTVVGVSTRRFIADFKTWAIGQVQSWGLRTDPIENTIKLRAMLLLRPSDARLHARLAEAWYFEGDLDAAQQSALRALELDENQIRALRIGAIALTTRARRIKDAAQRDELYQRAGGLLQRLIGLNPQSRVAAKLLAEGGLRRDDHDQAVRWYQKLKELCPLDPASYEHLAEVYLNRGESAEALPELIGLWARQQDDPGLPRQIGAICESQADAGGAALWYERSIQIDPYLEASHQDLARVCARIDDLQRAVREYQALCMLAPDRAEHFAQLAFTLNKMDRPDDARAAAARAVELDPDSPAKVLLGSR